MVDRSVLNRLPDVVAPTPTYGRIVRRDNQGDWKFIVMPTEIQTRHTSSYRASGSIGVMQSQQFQNYNEELSIPRVTFSTKYANKDLRQYVQSFINLIKPISSALSPPVLAFAWGQYVFNPCVITQATVTEKDWYSNAALATCTLSITLLKVPEDQVVII